MMNITSSSSHSQSYLSAPSLEQSISSGSRSGNSSVENPGSVLKPVTETGKTKNTATSTENNQSASSSEASTSPKQQQQRLEAQQERIEQQQIQQLAARDREVRNHERAHAAVGGQYAGAPRYEFERGPDGVNYAIGGEVSISTGGVPGDPQATIEKAQVVRRAALAPAEPSAQDRKVAAQATQMEAEARVELANVQREERLSEQQANTERNEDKAATAPEPPTQIGAQPPSDKDNPTKDAATSDAQNKFREQFSQQQNSLNRLITSSNANGLYSEPGQLLSQIA
ncbi:MAG: putative metalloprotease CJM1_0395 family protein [Cellvibrionaceae bacterium]